MKKTLLLTAVVTLSLGANAQWVKPELPVPETTSLVTTTADEAAGADAYYLYNVEAKSFYGHANAWNTRASLVAAPFEYFCNERNATMTAEPMQIKLVKDADTEGYGIQWVKADGGTDYTSPDTWEGVWVDGKRDGWNEFSITPTEGNNFTIGCSLRLEGGLLGVLSTDLSSAPVINLYNPAAVTDATLYSTWALVTVDAYNVARSEEEVAKYKEALPLYNAAVELRQAIDKAKAEYPDLDFSACEVVYNNTASTLEELQNATFQVTVIINDWKSGQASFDNPADLTEQIGDGSDVAPWTREFTGEGTVGTWHTNTWSTEANDGADGTNMTTPFCEDWVANGGLLSDQKIYKVIRNAAPGLYVFTANVRLYNEKGDQEALTGLTMYFGDDRVDVSTQAEMYKSNGKCVLWKDGFRLITVLKETGDIEVGFDIKDATFNWLAFKNTSLMYYGSEDADLHAVELYKEGYSYEKVEDDTYANAALVEAYNAAVDAYDNATNLEDVRAAIAAITDAKVAMEANHKAYEKLLAKIDEWTGNAETQELNGADWDNFLDFIVSGNNVDGYPEITPATITDGDRSMTNEEIDAYIAKIEELYAYAVAHSLTEGSDCTGMLVNPMFTEADGKGWTWEKNDNVTALAMRGGNEEFYCAEAYAGFNNNAGFLFDIHQEVADVPDGIYEISANCFYRWADNGQFTGEEVVPAVIYMNDFESPVQHIASNAVPYDQIMTTDEGGKEVLQEGWYGSWANTEGIGYVPNDMAAASCAFKKDMYKQTVYGLVEGGKMRIGIKKETKTEENRHWCLWTNFRLTFMGQNENAVASIVESLSANLEALLQTEVAAALSEEMISEAEDLISKAGNLSGEENYQLMKDLNAMVKKIKAVAAGNKEAMAELQKVYDAANAAMETDEYANDENYTIIVDDIAEWQAQMLEKVELGTLTDEERAEIMEKADEYVARLGIRGDWTKATEEAPVDMTSLIVNADFSTGNINGWTDTFTEGNHGFQNNAVYGDNTSEDGAYCDQFAEAWRAGNAALGSGSISQTIGELPYSFLAALPAGNYVLKADMNVQNQGDATIIGGVYLFAHNGENAYSKEITESSKTESGTVVTTQELKFTIAEDNRALNFGVMAIETQCNWFTADNFKLIYLGTGDAIAADPNDPTEISGIEAAPAVRTIYDLMGRKVNGTVKGIYIINGKKVVK